MNTYRRKNCFKFNYLYLDWVRMHFSVLQRFLWIGKYNHRSFSKCLLISLSSLVICWILPGQSNASRKPFRETNYQLVASPSFCFNKGKYYFYDILINISLKLNRFHALEWPDGPPILEWYELASPHLKSPLGSHLAYEVTSPDEISSHYVSIALSNLELKPYWLADKISAYPFNYWTFIYVFVN